MTGPRVLFFLGLMVLAACGERTPELRDLSTNRSTPEEFSIVPNKPLELPETYSQLPQPTPGGTNRTAQTPLADAVASLGGNPARLSETGVPASDSALLSSATRLGRAGDIRETLAQEDRAFRQRRSLFTWQIVNKDRYNRVYSSQRLDADLELLRFRRAGVRTPSAPPDAN